MKYFKLYFAYLLILSGLILNSSCLLAPKTINSNSDLVFVGCTPGDELIKSMLSIPSGTKVDFIRWELNLKITSENQQTFVLNIEFGESQPNTLGFIQGGHKKTLEGQFFISKYKHGNNSEEIYRLKSNLNSQEILMVKLNNNLFHLLTPQNQLIVGNGGWSYTLNNKEPVKNYYLPTLTTSSSFSNDSDLQVVYDGRTPCQDFAIEHNMNVSQSCFKLKWKLILNRDSVNHKPTTYSIRKVVNNEPIDLFGKWTIIKGTLSNPNVVIYQLDPDITEKTISLLKGDENILFFLYKDKQLFVGNSDFSYTLNRSKK
jgi:hypothetical protein